MVGGGGGGGGDGVVDGERNMGPSKRVGSSFSIISILANTTNDPSVGEVLLRSKVACTRSVRMILLENDTDDPSGGSSMMPSEVRLTVC